MKITIYELLGLIKDNKAPKKIGYHSISLEYDKENEDYYNYYGRGLLEYKFENCKNFLNDEVEIIEEPNKIEKLDKKECRWSSEVPVVNKINELIDEINKLKEDD